MFPTFGMMIGRGKCNMKLPKPQWKICIKITKLLGLFDEKKTRKLSHCCRAAKLAFNSGTL